MLFLATVAVSVQFLPTLVLEMTWFHCRHTSLHVVHSSRKGTRQNTSSNTSGGSAIAFPPLEPSTSAINSSVVGGKEEKLRDLREGTDSTLYVAAAGFWRKGGDQQRGCCCLLSHLFW